MKRVSVLLLITILVLGMSVTNVFAYEGSLITMEPNQKIADVNGEEVTLDVASKLVNGRFVVPIRFVAESLDIPVEWNAKDKTVLIGENKEIILKIGSKTATVEGKQVALDSPAVIENGFTLVPLRFVSESLGADVSWNAEDKNATIEYSKQLEKAKDLYSIPVEGETAVLNALDDKFAYDFATKLAAIGSAKDGRGFHLVGTKAGKEAADLAFNTFKQIGLDPQYHTFDCAGWTYNSSDIKIEGHDNLKYFITSAPYTPATSPGGLTGEIVAVGMATKDELKGMDLTGKIALAEFDWDNTLWMNDLAFQVASHGASGLIYYTTNPYGSDETGKAEFVGDWSGTTSKIPVWSMNQKEGKELAALAGKEKLTATATSDCELDRNATGYNVMATIQGSKYPDEYIVITAHTDAYFHCLQDDSAPVGVMMAMAKAMVDTKYKPERSIIFVTTDGEECGKMDTFYDWLVGSWALVNDKISQWGGKIVDSHTIEMLGDNKSSNFGYRASDTMYLFTRAIADGMNRSDAFDDDVTVDNYMTTSSDEWSFSYFGVPTTRTIMEDKADQVYHSSMDNPERFSYERFKNHLKAQTLLVMRVDQQAFAPYDLSRTAETYQNAMDAELLKAAGLDAAALDSAVASYLTDSWSMLDKNLQITELYNAAKASKKDTSKVDAMIADYNNNLRAAAKTVIQGTQYIALDTPVFQTDYYQYLPSKFEEAIALLKAGKGEEMLKNFDLDNDDQGQYTSWYYTTLEEKTWQDSYHEALNPDQKDVNYEWVTGVLLKNYDFYGTLDSVATKAKSGNKDFTAEIAALTAMKLDASQRLAAAYAEDLAMWKTAKAQLPLTKADQIIAELTKETK